MVGYDATGYRLYDKQSRKVIISRHVKFDETDAFTSFEQDKSESEALQPDEVKVKIKSDPDDSESKTSTVQPLTSSGTTGGSPGSHL